MIQIYQGDNVDVMSALCTELESQVSLAYLDPPYNSGRVYRTRQGAGGFVDVWESDRQYLDHLRLRLEAVKGLLADHGCCVVHVDWHVSGQVRVLGDEVFGVSAFASEIVWRYRRWPAKTRNFQRVHDMLFRWVREPGKHRWHQLYEPLSESTVKHWGSGKQLAEVGDDGRRSRSTSTSDPSPGAPIGDVWDIPIVAPRAHERTGYPTQKPQALLDRLISACTDEGDLVLDPYLGSGTTLASSKKLGRRGIGIDSSAEAIRVACNRLGVEPVRK